MKMKVRDCIERSATLTTQTSQTQRLAEKLTKNSTEEEQKRLKF